MISPIENAERGHSNELGEKSFTLHVFHLDNFKKIMYFLMHGLRVLMPPAGREVSLIMTG